jgi:molybdopterin molybdotransferase
MLTIQEARVLVLELARGSSPAPGPASGPALASPHVERVPIAQATGRVLAQELVSDTDLPPFDRVMMDGFAVRAAEAAAGALLPLQGQVAAGESAEGPLRPGHALAIMTGAPLPPGADAVVPQEWTGREAGGVRFQRSVTPGQHVAPRAEDLRAGQRVAGPGERVSTLALSLLIAAGAGEVAVRRRPRVALLTTGNELVPPGAPLRRGQIRESNGPALASLLLAAGADVVNLGVARDTRAALDERLAAASDADIVVLTGGASVGAFDYTAEALRAAGAEERFGKLSVKPGKPTLCYTRGSQLFFGLPGNPVAALMTGRVLVCAAVAVRRGLSPPAWAETQLPLAGPVRRVAERDQLLPMRVQDGALVFDGWHGSGDLACLARAEGFAFVARGAGSAPAGTPADWFPLPAEPTW